MTTKNNSDEIENPPDATSGMDRREFLTTTAVVGGGMALGFYLPSVAEAAGTTGSKVAAQPWYREAMVPEINAWIAIAPDETVTIRIGQTEIGTGVLTCNAMIVADELQCDWSKVRSEYASANRDAKEKAPEWTLKAPGNGTNDIHGFPNTDNQDKGVYRRMLIDSSGNVRESRYYLQMAGAEARERLLLAAATEWGVPVTECVAKNGVITHAKSKRSVKFGAIAAKAAQTKLADPGKIKLKTPDQWWLMGTDQPNVDVPLKITGQAVYASDLKFANMLYAAVRSCPVWGGDVKSYNFDAIKNMPGVQQVVRIPINDTTRKTGLWSGGVAVIADSYWHAKTALDKLPIEFDYGPNATVTSEQLLKHHFDLHKSEPGTVRMEWGNAANAMGTAAKVVEAQYSVAFSPRARMEPGNAVVLVTDDRLDMWSGEQGPQDRLRFASLLSGIKPENCYVHTTFLGGGYGNNGNGPQAEQAVIVANQLRGRPVKMMVSREEDWGVNTKYRPMGACSIKCGLDGNGFPVAWELHTTGADYAGDQQWRGLSAPPYWAPHYHYATHKPTHHVPAGTRRATGAGPNCFYLESFIDELAHLVGKDEYVYRRELIARNPAEDKPGGFPQRDDWLAALDMVTKMSGWGKPLPPGFARALAIDDRRRLSRDSHTIGAHVHVVEVTKRGQIILHRSDVVFETGYGVCHPMSVKKQIEGQIAWGFSDLFHGTTLKDGRAVETNFDSFPISRMKDYPRELNVQFLKTKRWITGAGEETIPQVPPAVMSAVFKITGKRVRTLPIGNVDLSWS